MLTAKHGKQTRIPADDSKRKLELNSISKQTGSMSADKRGQYAKLRIGLMLKQC